MVPVRRSPWGPLQLRSHADVQQLVEDLAAANRAYLANNAATPALYESGVRYRAEKVGEEDFLLIPEVRAQGHADCEDLAAWRAAEVGGIPVAVRTRKGYHVVVRMPDGSYEDPSRRLGMGGRDVKLVCGYLETPTGVHAVAVGRLDPERAIRSHVFVPYADHEQVSGFFGDIVRTVKNVAKSKAFKAVAGAALDIAATVVPGGALAKGAIELAGKALAGAKKAAPPPTSRAARPTRRRAPSRRARKARGRARGRARARPKRRRAAPRSLMARSFAATTAPYGGPLVTGPAGGYGSRYTGAYLKEARHFVRQLPKHMRVPVILHLLGRPAAARRTAL